MDNDIITEEMKHGMINGRNIEELTEEELIDNSLFEFIFSTDNDFIREDFIIKLQLRAKQLRTTRPFNNKLKLYREMYVKSQKGRECVETNFKECPYPKLKCGKWIADDTGIYKKEFNNNMQSITIKASPIPITIVERLINIDTNTEKVKIAFFKDGKWQEIIVEKNTISTKTKILQLANRGIEVNEGNAKNLITYLADLLELNNIPVKKGVSHLGWINDEFIPYSDKYCVDVEYEFKQKLDSIKSNGDYEKWKNYIKKIKNKSKTMRFLIASSFASPLVKIYNINSFMVHLWGTSGKGKTVTQMICASIWGNPAKGKLMVTLNSTKVASERMLSFFRNLPFIPDELQTIKSIYKNDFGDMIYNFTEGKGRDRGTVDGGLAESTEWDNISILSGEEPITANVSSEGIKNRVIEIEDNSEMIEDGNEVVNFISNNYGNAGKEFIEIIQKMNKEELYELRNKYVEELSKITKYKKQINAMSVILVADYIISEFIFDEKPLTVEDVKEYIRNDTDEADRYIELIIDIANANINNFYDSSKSFPPSGQIWGKLEKTSDGKGSIMYYDFIPTKLYEILNDNNINWNGIKKKMADKGYVKKDEKEKGYTMNVKIEGTQQRIIKIRNIYFDRD